MAVNGTIDNAKLQTVLDEIDDLAQRVRSMKSQMWDYDSQVGRASTPMTKIMVLFMILSTWLCGYLKENEVLCSSDYMSMFVLIHSVFLVIGMATFIFTLLRILTLRNLAKDVKEQMIQLGPQAIRLRDELNLLSPQTNADNSMTSWEMTQITWVIDDTDYGNLNRFLIDTPMSNVILSLMEIVMFTMIMMAMIFGGLDICVDSPTIALSPAGGFARTI